MSVQVYVCLLHLLIVSTAGEWCNFDQDNNYESYCSNGCCGQTCCFELDEDSPIPLIVGCTIAGLFVVITVAALVYACLKSNTRPGRVISVGGPTSVNSLTISSPGCGYTNYSVPVMAPQPPPYSLPQPPPYSLYPLTGTLPFSTTCMIQPPGYSEQPPNLTQHNHIPSPLPPHIQVNPVQIPSESSYIQNAQIQASHLTSTQTVPTHVSTQHHIQTVHDHPHSPSPHFQMEAS